MTKRTYSNDQIAVHWDSERCIHTGWCSASLEAVFDVNKRPWVQLEGAEVDAVVATVEQCPSGALRYERLDGGPGEAPDDPVSIVPWPNGPLFVRGEFKVEDRHGGEFETGPRATLCRCGESRNHPFCDLSHRKSEFRSYPRAVAEERSTAEVPTDVGPHFQ